jgi:hypothetical protein
MGSKNLIPLVLILIGFVLMVSAYRNDDPRNVVFDALGIKQRVALPSPLPGHIRGDIQQHVAGSGYSGDAGVKVTAV